MPRPRAVRVRDGLTLEDVYAFDPVPAELTTAEASGSSVSRYGVEYRRGTGPHPWQVRPDARGWPR